MGKFGPFLNASFIVNGIDLSNRVESLTLDLSKDVIDLMAMGDNAHVYYPSLENNKVTVNFWQDFAAAGTVNSVDATLTAIFQGGTGVAFSCSPNGTVYSTSNPKYSGTVILAAHQPLAGKVGDGLQTQVTFQMQGTITRGTT